MSNRTIDSASRSASSPQPATASEASVSRSTISSSQPQALAHLVEELGAVFGGAAGFGGDQARPRDAARRHLVAAYAQRLQRALDRRFARAGRSATALRPGGRCARTRRRRETRRRSGARPAGGNCWCPNPARRRDRGGAPAPASNGRRADRAAARARRIAGSTTGIEPNENSLRPRAQSRPRRHFAADCSKLDEGCNARRGAGRRLRA